MKSQRLLEGLLTKLRKEVKEAEQAVNEAKKAVEKAEKVSEAVIISLYDRLFKDVPELKNTGTADLIIMNALDYDTDWLESEQAALDAQVMLEIANKVLKERKELLRSVNEIYI